MKILFTLDTLAIGGTEKSTLDIVSHFSKKTMVKVVYFYPRDALKSDYENANIDLHFVNLKGKRSFYKGIKALIKIIKTEKPDLIVSSIARANFISRIAGLLTNTTIVGTFVNDSYGEIRIQEHKEQKKYLKFRYTWLLDFCTSFIPKYWISNCKSIAISNANALKINRKKIEVIYRGRDTKKFKEWQMPALNDNFKFVFIGRLIERKGLSELLDAFSLLKKTNKNIQLDIFGSGPFEKKIRDKIQKYSLEDSVIMHGPVDNGWRELYNAHCFVFPSWYEGFSGSLVEAMIAGMPIVASDITMNKEAVTDLKTALIFKVMDSKDLLSKMEIVIKNYPEMIEMGKKAREEALNRFDIVTISNQYEQFLNSIVNKKVNIGQL